MNGAEALVRTLLAGGVDTCFANPGTSEMHFVAALDRFPAMRCVLALFEGVATGAADGYARMADKPAATLLHLGAGLANGLANLHNARRANTPMVNVIGDHATYHRALDAPLTSDVEAVARTWSHWVRSTETPAAVGPDTAEAIRMAMSAPGKLASLILPGDAAWDMGGVPAPAPVIAPRRKVADGAIELAARALTSGEPCLLLVGGMGGRAAAMANAGRIAAKTGAK
ncbi:MAG: thiamine pyrophosphate-binding protein, partial [Elsteraceae bacterium]